MSNNRIYEIAKDWASHIEGEIRLHTGMPREGRQEANAIAHNAILGALREILEDAARMVESMVVVGRQWTEEQGIAGNALLEAAKNIRSLKTDGHNK